MYTAKVDNTEKNGEIDIILIFIRDMISLPANLSSALKEEFITSVNGMQSVRITIARGCHYICLPCR